MFEFGRREYHKARKQHECHLCGKPILPGARYVHEVMKFDGEFQQLNRHIACDEILNEYMSANDFPEGYTETEVYDWAYDKACKSCNHRDFCTYQRAGIKPLFECKYALERLLPKTACESAMNDLQKRYMMEG